MRKALVIAGLVMGLLVGLFSGFIAMLANAHDGYTQSDAIRDYALWFLVYIPAGGFLGYSVGRLHAVAIDYMRQSVGARIGAISLVIMTIFLSALAVWSLLALCLWLFYPLGY